MERDGNPFAMTHLKQDISTAFRLAIAGCFIGHGTIAIQNSNIYFSEWNNWVQQLFPEDQKLFGAEVMLNAVGAIDILVGICFLLPEVPSYALAWSMIWGAMTAASRIYFLSGLVPGFWMSVVNPLAQFLIRTPNWMIPVVFFIFYSGRVPQTPIRRISQKSWMTLGAVTQVAGLFLIYLVELYHPLFPYEIEKKSMPLWYFHAGGLFTVLALSVFAFSFVGKFGQATFKSASIFAIIAYTFNEGFEIFSNSPHGIKFTSLRIIEHAPIYVCLGYLAYLNFRGHRCSALSKPFNCD